MFDSCIEELQYFGVDDIHTWEEIDFRPFLIEAFVHKDTEVVNQRGIGRLGEVRGEVGVLRQGLSAKIA